MRKRGSQPVLYELMRPGQAPPPGAAPRSGSQREAPSPSQPRSAPAAPRQWIRVPIGWFWVFAIVIVAALVGAYQFGLARGEKVGIARAEDQARSQAEVDRVNRAVPDGAVQPPAAAARPGETLTANDSGGNAGGDPRKKGWTYVAVARIGAEDADKLIAFLHANGVEATVISDNNARLRRVIALPGFPPNTGSGSEAKSLLAKVKSLGAAWASQARGNRAFDDAYLTQPNP